MDSKENIYTFKKMREKEKEREGMEREREAVLYPHSVCVVIFIPDSLR